MNEEPKVVDTEFEKAKKTEAKIVEVEEEDYGKCHRNTTRDCVGPECSMWHVDEPDEKEPAADSQEPTKEGEGEEEEEDGEDFLEGCAEVLAAEAALDAAQAKEEFYETQLEMLEEQREMAEKLMGDEPGELIAEPKIGCTPGASEPPLKDERDEVKKEK